MGWVENRYNEWIEKQQKDRCGSRGRGNFWVRGAIWAHLLLWLSLLSLSSVLLFGGGKAEGGGKATGPTTAAPLEKIASLERIEKASFPLEIRDSYNRKVRLPAPPQRIVSCAPNMTEIVFYLGEGKRQVGRTDWCNWPEEAKKIPSVGGLQDPNIERIVQLKADLVLASSHFQRETVELLESVGIPVYVGLASREYEEVYRLIRSVGLLLGIPKNAEGKVKEMRDQMERIRKETGAIPNKPKVYYMISFGDEGDYTAGADTHIAQLIRWAGGRNVGDVIRGWRFSVEGLVKEDPDMILVRQGWRIPEQLKRLSPYRELRAVREGEVYEIDVDSIDRMGPRNVEGLRQLVKVIHPELSLP